VQRYPPRCHGGNACEAYADVEAVRVLERPGTSLRRIVVEAARRYSTPVALTEAHIGCTAAEQVRWLRDAWTTCAQLVEQGVAIQAVTPWALLGSYDWDTLVTENRGHYEPGAFDSSGSRLQPTALSGMIAAVARARRDGTALTLPGGEGWWRRPERLTYPVDPGGADCEPDEIFFPRTESPRARAAS
jgi:dTDP-4-dehydrorhamnose reductase